jgi:hypothetical protein
VIDQLKGREFLGPLLSWYYRSEIASSGIESKYASGIPWDYLISYTCLLLYTLVLTLR